VAEAQRGSRYNIALEPTPRGDSMPPPRGAVQRER
jgi:hypothetical protein